MDERAVTRLGEALAVLLPLLDVVEGRAAGDEVPAWCERRGWVGFLRSLDDASLGRCERDGLAAVVGGLAGAPADLVELGAAVGRCCRCATWRGGVALDAASTIAINPRKQAQIAALLSAARGLVAGCVRVVDVGAGQGHLARLTAEHFDREVRGLERDGGLVAAATARAEARAARAPAAARARFTCIDALAAPIELAPSDLAVGLHACGEVGDRLVARAAEVGCDLALVSCCFQKVSGPSRRPLSAAGEGLDLPRHVLGLANLAPGDQGVEASLDANLAARQARLALHLLLGSRGVHVAPGEAMRGINRRRAQGGLAPLAAAALEARGLAPPTSAELEHHQRRAAEAHGVERRLALPRHMLARLVELAIVLDRAARLEESGHHTRVVCLVDAAHTPRNLLLLASRHAARLVAPPVPMGGSRSSGSSSP